MTFEDETMRMYIEESLEHLSDIENDLLSIEEAGADIDEELVNSVFRAAHSIKGGAGFMGLGTIKELAHKTENVLGMIRSREIVPSPKVISILLQAFDTLRDMVTDVENSHQIDIAGHLDALVELTTTSLPPSRKDRVDATVDIVLKDGRHVLTALEFDLDQARKDGKFIYLVEYDLIHDIQRKNRTPLDVISYLLNSGTIIQSKIDFDAIGTLEDKTPSRIPFYILFASVIEPEIILSLFDVDERFVHQIGEDGIIATPEIETESAPETDETPAAKKVVSGSPPPPAPSEASPAEHPVNLEEATVGIFAAEGPGRMKSSASQTSLRVHVSLLDLLMTLAGELVLSRNQLMQSITSGNSRGLETAGQRIDMVTSELQEAIMRTRMQSIANVFNKFPRVVRDMAREMGKQVDLTIEGKGVELDKTIIEAISDPLTHLVRNAVDHGIESAEDRTAVGKPPVGKVKLSAYHEAGQVNIEIADDGRGLDGDRLVSAAVKKGLLNEQQASLMSEKEKFNIIFLPSFSTARKVTDVSGRGVGMDVVKTNLDRLGGIVDIDSEAGLGTTIRIKLPLTLAIIPSQIISIGNERYAIPQVNLNELLRIPASQVKNRIEKVGDANVVRLRGNLLPLLNLAHVLDIRKTYTDPDDGQCFPERRVNLADRRSQKSPLHSNGEETTNPNKPATTPTDASFVPRSGVERRVSVNSAVNIAVVSAGAFKYGLVVDRLRDSEEIVVKPLGRHLKGCNAYAGATIMGDGRVALILDVAGLAQMAELTSLEGTDRVAEAAKEAAKDKKAELNRMSLLLFRNTEEEQCAVPLGLVERVERINARDIESVGGKKVIQYRGGSLPLFSLDQAANVSPLPDAPQLEVIVFQVAEKEVGLMVMPPVDAVDVAIDVDKITLKQTGIVGSAVINGKTTLMVDMAEVVQSVNPEWFQDATRVKPAAEGAPTVLFAEDSDFFRDQVVTVLHEAGYNVIAAENGQQAWSLLNQQEGEVNLVLTDLEMPEMDGFELTSRIKADERFSHLRVIALTSLADDEDIAKGTRVGIDDYQIKLDRDKLLGTVRRHLET